MHHRTSTPLTLQDIAKRLNSLETLLKELAEGLREKRVLYPPYLTLKEACEYARVCKDTMRRWLEEGYVVGHREKGKWIINRQSIDDYLSSQSRIIEQKIREMV